MLEAGIPLTVVGSILGWSGSTMVLMAKRYGHIGMQAKQDAVALLDRPQKPGLPGQPSNQPEASTQGHNTGRTVN